MPAPIAPIRIPDPASIALPRPGPQDGPGFSTVLGDAIHRVEAFQQDASRKVENFLSGENEDLHTAAMSVQRAELVFELFQQVRNKVVQAYQEVMRMQV
jgi:flagellar hook-basal body complex protein FliE